MRGLRIVSFPWKACPACGSLFVNPSLLCSFCEGELQRVYSVTPEGVGPWVVRSLWSWQAGESDRLSALLSGLKGRYRREAWAFWAKEFTRAQAEFLPRGPLKLVSAPRRASGHRDHAYFFAEMLSRETGIPWAGSPFQKRSERQQRRLAGEERARALTLVKTTELKPSPETFWVFIDDIVTSGATAEAVYQALGRPPRFEIWCLARRK